MYWIPLITVFHSLLDNEWKSISVAAALTQKFQPDRMKCCVPFPWLLPTVPWEAMGRGQNVCAVSNEVTMTPT